MSLLQRLIDYFYLTLLKIKGTRTFSIHPEGEIKLATLNVVTVFDYDIVIHCKCIHYKFVYMDKLMPNKSYYLYSAHGECSEDAPENLKKIIKAKVHFPRLASKHLSTEAHNRILVEAYFDILIKKLNDFNSKT